VSTVVRAEPEFAATVTVTAPDPVPLAGERLTQDAVPMAVQPQLASLAVTVTVAVTPAADAASEVADNA
jgi:hypothetical protein